MSLTDDPTDPRLGRGPGGEGMNEAYLVLSEEERAKGFVRPLYRAYRHHRPTPTYPLRDLTEDERERLSDYGYVKHEAYPESDSSVVGRYWTQDQLDEAETGCGIVTSMALALCETYARQPSFYGATYCSGCGSHYPVGEQGEFTWVVADDDLTKGWHDTGVKVGT